MKVLSSTSFVHEAAEGRVYHFNFPGSFPLQEGLAVCHTICQELQKKMEEMAKSAEDAPKPEEPVASEGV